MEILKRGRAPFRTPFIEKGLLYFVRVGGRACPFIVFNKRLLFFMGVQKGAYPPWGLKGGVPPLFK